MLLKKTVTIAGIMALGGSSLLADFTYQQTSTITGGMMMSMMRIAGAFSKQAREPIQSTIAVKGDKMVHRTANSASVIDLASGTITTIDFQKKQYSVMTFEEMKQLMEQMSQKMQKAKGDKGEVKFKMSANATGKSKQVAGFEAKEMIMKMEMEGTDKKTGQESAGGLTVTTDMWIAEGIPGYREVRDFQKRMAEKLNWNPGGSMFMGNPQVSQGMAEVSREIAKMDGVPVQQFISMGMAGQPGAAGAPADGNAPAAQQQPAAPPASVGGALGGALGGRFGLGKKKPADQPAAQANAPAAGGQAPGAPGSLLEMTTELTSFSSNPVDSSLLAVPAGFKQVDSELKKMK